MSIKFHILLISLPHYTEVQLAAFSVSLWNILMSSFHHAPLCATLKLSDRQNMSKPCCGETAEKLRSLHYQLPATSSPPPPQSLQRQDSFVWLCLLLCLVAVQITTVVESRLLSEYVGTSFVSTIGHPPPSTSTERFLRSHFMFALLLCSAAVSRAAPRAKHVVLIGVDDLRPDMSGPYGQKQVETPNLDRLASR